MMVGLQHLKMLLVITIRGGVKNPFLDNQVIPLNLSRPEIKDLVAMLRSLEGEGWQHVKVPTEFPQ